MVSVYSPRWFAEDKPEMRNCDMPGCDKKGEHKAPRTRGSSESKDYHWFCLEHVTQYNKSWNYFAGMSEMETELYWQDIHTSHRPTWKRDRTKFNPANLEEAVRRGFSDYFTGESSAEAEPDQRIMPVDRRVQDALAVLDLDWPVTVETMKMQFKVLVKKYHPDANKSKGAEERFKKITEAYQVLRASLEGTL